MEKKLDEYKDVRPDPGVDDEDNPRQYYGNLDISMSEKELDVWLKQHRIRRKQFEKDMNNIIEKMSHI